MKTNCRFEKIKAEIKFVHDNIIIFDFFFGGGGGSLPLVFQRNWPWVFPRNSREIGRFFREFVPENPAKFAFFFCGLPEAL